MNKGTVQREREMRDAVQFLYDLPKFTKKNGLAHTRKLMSLLGDPCAERMIIHVAGSNGKGSVCSFLYHMLLAGGVSAAMFTSPHLIDIRERFQVCGRIVTEDEFLSAYALVSEKAGELVERGEAHPTFFEFVYAMGMVMFEEAKAEYIVLETGLGGRLDATNSFPTPVLTVITPISREHTEILGDTISQIASEKAGILKPGVPVVYAAGGAGIMSGEISEAGDAGEAADVIAARAESLRCPGVAVYSCDMTEKPEAPEGKEHCSWTDAHKSFFYIYKIRENTIDFSLISDYDETTTYDKVTDWQVPGCALYQAENAALAIEAIRFLPVYLSDEVLQQGLSSTSWPGRMQEALPDIWFDGAHNPAGIGVFIDTVRKLTADDEKAPMLLFSMLREKDLDTSVRLLAEGLKWDSVAVTMVPGERSVAPERLAELFGRYLESGAEDGKMDCLSDVRQFCDYRGAFEFMRGEKHTGQKLFCTGSLYFIGALLELTGE